MNEEVKNTTTEVEEKKPKREPSPGEIKTDLFKRHIQKVIRDKFDIKVSKDTAWQFFKEINEATLQFVVSQEDKRLPLSGVGTYEVIVAKTRGKEKKEGRLVTPRYRFYPSTAMQRTTQEMMGEEPFSEEIKGLGIYEEDGMEHFQQQAVVNNDWLQNQIVPEEEDGEETEEDKEE